MPEEIVATDQCGQVVVHDEWNSLEPKWLPSTVGAMDADVKTTAEVFAQEADARPSPTRQVVSRASACRGAG